MEKVNLKEKVALVYDYGLFVSLASKLGETFEKVYYYVPFKNAFPLSNGGLVGKGMPNIERILNLWDVIDEVDIFIFPDVYDGDLQEYLIRKKKRVFGSRKGEKMELDRVWMKKKMKSLGLPVNDYKEIVGLDNLRKYLKSNDNKWVKISYWRGDFETFKHETYKLSEPKLDELEWRLGAKKSIEVFLVEEDLKDKVEIGYDGICIDGEFPPKGVCGIEIKDLGYIGQFREYKDIPEEITGFNTKMKDTLKNFGYRGFYSTEIRVGEDKKPYMLDMCARSGSPPNEVYQEMYENLAELIWYGSEGKVIEPIPVGKYGLEVLIHSQWADSNWQSIYFPEEYSKNIKLRNATVIDGVYYIVPQLQGVPEIGAIVAVEDTVEACVNKVKEIAEQVKGYYINIKVESIETAIEEINKTLNLGIKIFSEDIEFKQKT